MIEIVLASASPRRAELLDKIGVLYRIAPAGVEEGRPVRPWPLWVQEAAEKKALTVGAGRGEIVLAADTIVVCAGRVLEKPADKREARQMLGVLSGRVHRVITGICVLNGQDQSVYRDVETTKVHFRRLSPAEIEAYLDSGEPLDKAGAYGIQGLGALLTERIEGCYDNVVGLPLVKTMRLLRRCGLNILGEGAPAAECPGKERP